MTRLSRIISALLITVMVLSFTACNGGGDEPETTTKAKKSNAEKNSVVTIPLAYEPLSADEEEFKDGEHKWQHVFPGFASIEREYPALAAALTKLNQETDAEAEKTLEKMKTESEEAKTKYGIAFFPGELYSRQKYLARRADTSVVSLVRQTDSYNGTSNPVTLLETFNFDTNSGQRLLTDDIFPDFKGFIPKLAKALTDAYPDTEFAEPGLEKSIKALYNTDDIQFSIDYEGITFYFNPETVADYDEGILAVSFSYEQLSKDIIVKYTEIPGTYTYCFTKDIPNFRGVTFELKNDNPLGLYEGMTLKFDGSEQKLENFVCSSYCLYLVHKGRGADYIYVDMDGEDGYGGLYIYSLGAKNLYETKYLDKVSIIATELGDSTPCYAEMFTCPSRFILGTRCDMLSTSVAKNKYEVGSDGVPRLLNKENLYVIDSMRLYTLRSDIRDVEGVLMKSGTKFVFSSTDLDDKVVFTTEDGLEHIFSLSEINVKRTVDGIEYAG